MAWGAVLNSDHPAHKRATCRALAQRRQAGQRRPAGDRCACHPRPGPHRRRDRSRCSRVYDEEQQLRHPRRRAQADPRRQDPHKAALAFWLGRYDRPRRPKPSPGEREVLAAGGNGISHKAIARQLGIHHEHHADQPQARPLQISELRSTYRLCRPLQRTQQGSSAGNTCQGCLNGNQQRRQLTHNWPLASAAIRTEQEGILK